MRVRAVLFVVGVLVAAALVASYLLERVEAPAPVVEPRVVERAEPPPPPAAPAPVAERAVEAPEVAVPDEAAKPTEAPTEPPSVPFLVAQGSQALRAVCQDALDSCAARYPPWFSSSVATELELERSGTGSRIVRAHLGAQKNGPPAFLNCVADALSGGELSDLALDADQQMVRCLPRAPKNTAFPSATKFRDDLKRCLPRMPEGEVTARYDVVNDRGTLRTGDVTFEGLGEVDAYARRCLELGFEAKVSVSPNEVPRVLPSMTLTVSEGGRKVSNSVSFGAP